MKGTLESAQEGDNWTILIGPESGFSPTECAALRAMDQVTAVNIGPKNLRAEIAAVAALALY
jgi:16S rRNA (uracil1498-N3)-methyltransferase